MIFRLGRMALGAIAMLLIGGTVAAQAQGPAFRVDPYWPKPLPNNWILGQVGGIVDRRPG